jgi:hypothetical protein
MDKLAPFFRPSLQIHRRQRFWQIILPIVLFCILIGVAGGLTIFAEGDLSRLWADVSIIWLVLPLLFFALLFLVILVGMIYLLNRLTKLIPRISLKVQNIFTRIEQETCRASNSIVKPVIWIHQLQSGLKRLTRKKLPALHEGNNYGREKPINTN